MAALCVLASGCGGSTSETQTTGSTAPATRSSGTSTAKALPVAPAGGTKARKVVLTGGTGATGGKALSFAATTRAQLAAEKPGSQLTLELRGVNLGKSPKPDFAHPDYVSETRCIGPSPCRWTVAPEAAAKYEFRAFLVDLEGHKVSGLSKPVRIDWSAPPRPRDVTLLINGKKLPITALDGEDNEDNYHPIPVGKVHVKAVWKTDAGGTGYHVTISHANPAVDAVCTTGTTCEVKKPASIDKGMEQEWTVKLLTTRGKQLVSGFKVCLVGAAA